MKKSFILLITGMLILSSCVTKKSKHDLSTMSRLYHNTTSQYNGYFNADLLVQGAITGLNDAHSDNYNQLLEVYEYASVPDVSGVKSDMDKAIEKVSTVITLHRESDWVDDCYLLFGQAEYIKQDYESAEQTLKFLTDNFNPEDFLYKNNGKQRKSKKELKKERKQKAKTKKKKQKEKKKERKVKKKERDKNRKANEKKRSQEKKRKKYNKDLKKKKSNKNKNKVKSAYTEEDKKVKKDEKENKEEKKEEKEEKEIKDKDGGFLKKRPAYQDGLIWLGRTYLERNKFDLAARTFAQIENDPSTPKEVLIQLNPAIADMHIKQNNMDEAVVYLKKAIDLKPKRQDKARYAYICAQILQNKNENTESKKYFAIARKASLDYEMQFSADLAMLTNGYKNGEISTESAIKRLEKMVKDEKNIEYLDKVYYAMAIISLENNDKDVAVDYLKKSLSSNTSNTSQKIESYIRLGYLYYGGDDFVHAKLYFDSTASILPKSDTRFWEITSLNDKLTGIAANMKELLLQDSLIMVSNMSSKDQLELVKKLEAEEKKRLEANKLNNSTSDKFNKGRITTHGSNFRPSKAPSLASSKSNFFVYNERAVKRGQRDFIKVWNNISLEDDWRRSSRLGAQTNEQGETQTNLENEVLDSELIDKWLSLVPKTDTDLDAINKTREEALMNLGKLFYDKIERDDKVIEVLEDKFLVEFPKSDQIKDAYYYLFLAYDRLNNSTKRDFYKQKILDEFPNSKYADVLSDPDYFKKAKADANKLEHFYTKTYLLFEKGNFKDVLKNVTKSKSEFGDDNAYSAKFALISAMSTGNISGKEKYIQELKSLIGTYPDTEESTRAKEILRLLGDKTIASKTTKKRGQSDGKFSRPEEKDLHYVIIKINNQGKSKIADIKADVFAFNRKHYKNDRIKLSTVTIQRGKSIPVFILRKFRNKDLAQKYHDHIMKKGSGAVQDDVEIQAYPITQKNYRTVIKEKSLEAYHDFYLENYN